MDRARYAPAGAKTAELAEVNLSRAQDTQFVATLPDDDNRCPTRIEPL